MTPEMYNEIITSLLELNTRTWSIYRKISDLMFIVVLSNSVIISIITTILLIAILLRK